MSKAIKQDLAHRLAARLVLEYLSSHSLSHTRACIGAETHGGLRGDSEITAAIAESELGVPEGRLDGLVESWADSGEETVRQNRDALSRRVEERLAGQGAPASRAKSGSSP
jgi:hypothetical protein